MAIREPQEKKKQVQQRGAGCKKEQGWCDPEKIALKTLTLEKLHWKSSLSVLVQKVRNSNEHHQCCSSPHRKCLMIQWLSHTWCTLVAYACNTASSEALQICRNQQDDGSDGDGSVLYQKQLSSLHLPALHKPLKLPWIYDQLLLWKKRRNCYQHVCPDGTVTLAFWTLASRHWYLRPWQSPAPCSSQSSS